MVIYLKLQMEHYVVEHLDSFLKNNNALKYLKYDALNTLILKKRWSEISGNVLSKQLVVSYIRGKLLVLECKNPCWKQEIEFYKLPLMKKINESLSLKIKIEWIKVEIALDV